MERETRVEHRHTEREQPQSHEERPPPQLVKLEREGWEGVEGDKRARMRFRWDLDPNWSYYRHANPKAGVVYLTYTAYPATGWRPPDPTRSASMP